jgi:uncharacterized protein YbaR (Trm112 family)
MIRIVCPHCHGSLAFHELEQAEMSGRRCLLCPDCASVLVSESAESECDLRHHDQHRTGIHKENALPGSDLDLCLDRRNGDRSVPDTAAMKWLKGDR